MDFAQEKRAALGILKAIEDGRQSTSAIAHLMTDADPALVHLIVSWLREKYGAGHPAAEGVVGRIVELSQSSGLFRQKMSEGKRDSIVTWFEETHQYREFSSNEFIDFIVDKLEG